MEERQISKAVIKRLPRYYRYLGEILDSGMERISSGELSSRMKVTASQIWAVSMPFSVLDADREKAVVECVYRELYTPVGLRTLSPSDEEFKPEY